MSNANNQAPDLPYRRHRRGGRSDTAFTVVAGRRVHLGVYGSPESLEKLNEVAALARSGKRFDTGPMTVNDLAVRYERHALRYYRKGGKPTGTVATIELMTRVVCKLFGGVAVAEFRASHLKAVREEFIGMGYTRPGVNRMATLVRGMFRWAAEEFEDDDTFALTASRLAHVAPLKRGRTEASEPSGVRPAPEEDITAVAPFVAPQVWAMIQLQLVTGARPGEIVRLRGEDIDRSGDVWVCELADHKTMHHGHRRFLHFGPKAQEIMAPWIARAGGGYLFSPLSACRIMKAEMRTGPGRRPGQKPNPRTSDRRVSDHYDASSYRRAITRACDDADVPRWRPGQLRHNYATRVRKRLSIDAAQAALGHKNLSTTEIYAELEQTKAADVARLVG